MGGKPNICKIDEALDCFIDNRYKSLLRMFKIGNSVFIFTSFNLYAYLFM